MADILIGVCLFVYGLAILLFAALSTGLGGFL